MRLKDKIALISLLASDEAGFISAEVLRADGGIVIRT